MSDDAGHLALVIAAVNDETTKKRLVELQKARDEAREAVEELRQENDANQAVLRQISEARAAAEAASEGLAQREAKLAEDTTALVGEINKFKGEKLLWEQQRVRDETAYTEKHTKLSHERGAHDAAVAAHRTKEAELNGRLSTVVQRENRVARQQKAMEDALKVT